MPYKTAVTGVSLGSDGYQMLQAIFQSGNLRSRYMYGRGIIAFSSLRQLGDRERAHQAITEHLGDYPDDLVGLQCLSAAESGLGNYAKCAEVSERGLALLEQGAEVHPRL